ncbi:MAG TPA: hypothetical protein VNO43_16450 [Candidatus Eisenbacteria bacterium]|nr:hypothetical protein [Candidatus Eisenbacteria bacterium]
MRTRRERSFKQSAAWLLLAGLCAALPAVAGEDDPPLPPGTYRLEMIMASRARLPLFGESKSASKSVSLVTVRKEGSARIQRHQVCEFRVLEDSAMIKMVFPDRFVAALAVHTYPVELERDTHGWRYRADLGVEQIGYTPERDGSRLPTTIDDPSVYDWDGDGQPAATLKIAVPLLPDGELYVVQRGHSILNGRITGEGKVEGSIDVRVFEQRVLGARPGFLNRSPEIRAEPGESRFSLTRLAPDSTCASLRERGSGLGQENRRGRP